MLKPTTVNENELIDISSDDSDEQPYQNQCEKPTNGASTSQKSSSNQPSPKHNIEENNTDQAELLNINKAQGKLLSSTPFNDKGKKRKLERDVSVFAPSPKKKKSIATLQQPSITFKDIGGLDNILEEVCKLLVHVRHPEVYRQIGISPTRGFLLHGPPGCGKTLLGNAIAGVSIVISRSLF